MFMKRNNSTNNLLILLLRFGKQKNYYTNLIKLNFPTLINKASCSIPSHLSLFPLVVQISQEYNFRLCILLSLVLLVCPELTSAFAPLEVGLVFVYISRETKVRDLADAVCDHQNVPCSQVAMHYLHNAYYYYLYFLSKERCAQGRDQYRTS